MLENPTGPGPETLTPPAPPEPPVTSPESRPTIPEPDLLAGVKEKLAAQVGPAHDADMDKTAEDALKNARQELATAHLDIPTAPVSPSTKEPSSTPQKAKENVFKRLTGWFTGGSRAPESTPAAAPPPANAETVKPEEGTGAFFRPSPDKAPAPAAESSEPPIEPVPKPADTTESDEAKKIQDEAAKAIARADMDKKVNAMTPDEVASQVDGILNAGDDTTASMLKELNKPAEPPLESHHLSFSAPGVEGAKNATSLDELIQLITKGSEPVAETTVHVSDSDAKPGSEALRVYEKSGEAFVEVAETPVKNGEAEIKLGARDPEIIDQSVKDAKKEGVVGVSESDLNKTEGHEYIAVTPTDAPDVFTSEEMKNLKALASAEVDLTEHKSSEEEPAVKPESTGTAHHGDISNKGSMEGAPKADEVVPVLVESEEQTSSASVPTVAETPLEAEIKTSAEPAPAVEDKPHEPENTPSEEDALEQIREKMKRGERLTEDDLQKIPKVVAEMDERIKKIEEAMGDKLQPATASSDH